MANLLHLSMIVTAAIFIFSMSCRAQQSCSFEKLQGKCTCPKAEPGIRDLSVECSCTKGQTLHLTYDELAGVHSDAKLFLVKDCEGEVLVEEGVLDTFIDLKSIVFKRISKLRLLKDSLIFHQTGKLEFQDVDQIELQPGSVAIVGDGISNVTVSNSKVVVLGQESTSQSNAKGTRVGESAFECHCDQLYPISDPSNVEDLLRRAFECSITEELVKKKECRPKPTSPSAVPSIGGIYGMAVVALAMVCLSLSL